ncbi:MAG: hypothetical protein V4678_03295 [Patescibacteria group bacterium]
MSQNTVVSIGGIDYDGHSGLPVAKQEAAVQKELRRVQSVHATGVHRSQQRSTALNRQFVKKVAAPARKPVSRPAAGSMMDMRRPTKRSPHISKFARDPQAMAVKRAVQDIGPVAHPVMNKVAHKTHAPARHHATTPVSTSPTARDIKHAAIGKALAHASEETKQSSAEPPRRRAFNVALASLGVLMITGYFTYVNMPNLSVRVAAAQAGIDASYPEYRPIGYRLNGPVAYQNGQVSMKFASNSGPVAFALNQSSSSWDSSALLEKYVDPRSEGKYATYNDGGLTIYTYGTDAAWVNGGILYTVEGTATLSNEQVRRIATSM